MRNPYQQWIDENLLGLADITYNGEVCPIETTDIKTRQRLYNYTIEDIQEVITPMAQNANEALGAMGTDTPLAVLSEYPQIFPSYFKQLFAQVTNPPLDGIREEIVTDISLALGQDRNIFERIPKHCRKLQIQNPVISNEDLEKIRNIKADGFKAQTTEILYPKEKGVNGLEDALEYIIKDVERGISKGVNINYPV